jgi:hypothetical protein
MRFKGHSDGRSVDHFGLLHHLSEKRLMSDVDPVKVADGYDGISEWIFNVIEVFDEFHLVRSIPN